MKVYISKGNSKLGAVLNVSLPPIITCRCDAPCRNKDCYALKAWRQYPGTRAAWRGNLEAYKTSADDYFDALANKFRKSKVTLIRYHVGGDIPDAAYLAGMIRVAKELPKKRFLCFTKKYELARDAAWALENDVPTWQLPKNLTIVVSAWPGFGGDVAFEYGQSFGIAWMRDPKSPDSRIPADARECPGNCETCGLCWKLKAGESVVFDKH